MTTVKINVFSVQTALKHGNVFWVQNQQFAQVTCFLPKTIKPSHNNLAL